MDDDREEDGDGDVLLILLLLLLDGAGPPVDGLPIEIKWMILNNSEVEFILR